MVRVSELRASRVYGLSAQLSEGKVLIRLPIRRVIRGNSGSVPISAFLLLGICFLGKNTEFLQEDKKLLLLLLS